MNMDIKDRVKQVLVKNAFKGIEPDDLEDNTLLIDYGVGLDSVATLELVVALEEEFKVRIDESEITPEIFETIGSMSNHIAQKV